MARLMSGLDPGGGAKTVLVATSGDTGSAVAHAFHEVEGYRVIVLFPRDGVSARQRRLMTTLGGNVRALAVGGTFDDCQRLAKQAFGDPRLRTRHGLTSANSINIGRLLPQAFYYLHAAILLGWARNPVRFVVPSGNLGNLCSGLIAHLSGMPNRGFVSAMNANCAFLDYLEQGVFEPRASLSTFSNAMDVGDPSNLERIRWLYRDDPARLRRDVAGFSVSDEETSACITDVYGRTGYVLDPHTAVGVRAYERSAWTGQGPSVVLATAHPAKFPDVVEKAIGRAVPLPRSIAAAMEAEEHMIDIAADLGALSAALDEE
jgi:threonine synthase